jgi:hypothetical protein
MCTYRRTGHHRDVRWDELFADLETEALGLELRDQDLEIAERTRLELARIDVAARLRAAVGVDVELRVDVAGPLLGRLERVAPQWVLLRAGAVQWVVATTALLGARGLPAGAVTQPPGRLEARLGWAAAWRVLARDRSRLHVVRRDGSTLDAVADRVGEDFVELAVARDDAMSGERGTRRHELVPFGAVVAVRCPSG